MSNIYFPKTLYIPAHENAAFSMNMLFGIDAVWFIPLLDLQNIIQRNEFVLQPLIESKALCTANYIEIKHMHLPDT